MCICLHTYLHCMYFCFVFSNLYMLWCYTLFQFCQASKKGLLSLGFHPWPGGDGWPSWSLLFVFFCCLLPENHRNTIGKWWLNGILWGITFWFHQTWLENPPIIMGGLSGKSSIHGLVSSTPCLMTPEGKFREVGSIMAVSMGMGYFIPYPLGFIHANTEWGIYQTRILFQTKGTGDTMGNRLCGMPPWDAMLEWPSLGCGTPQLETNLRTIKYDTMIQLPN